MGAVIPILCEKIPKTKKAADVKSAAVVEGGTFNKNIWLIKK